MREEDILPSEDGKDKEQPSGKHEKHQNRKDDSEKERKEGMDVLQSHHWDIPEQKDEKEEDQTGDDEQSNEDPLLRSYFQCKPHPNSELNYPRLEDEGFLNILST